jgi:regulator of chromosome condensation (RCC1) repeat-containing protein
MITSARNRATVGRVVALGLLLAALLAMLLSAAPAGAAAPPGKALSWGSNYYGTLGNGTSGPGTERNVPVAVRNLEGVKSVQAGGFHSLALKKDGTVYAWGYNVSGQLGNGTTEASDVPVKVKNLSGVKAISAGQSHSLALKKDGSVWAWGSNQYGQLGIGTSGAYDIRSTPIKVGSLGTGAKGIAAGYLFSLALMTDGTVNYWGFNGHGQLGNGTEADRSTPGAVTNLTGVKAIATDSNASHVLALLEDGTVKSWGYNYYGQLGDGASGPNAARNTPGDVIGLTNVKSVAGGTSHSLAVLQSGRVRSWGLNSWGELGNGTSGAGTYRSTPGAVKNLSNVRNIAGGNAFTLAAVT